MKHIFKAILCISMLLSAHMAMACTYTFKNISGSEKTVRFHETGINGKGWQKYVLKNGESMTYDSWGVNCLHIEVTRPEYTEKQEACCGNTSICIKSNETIAQWNGSTCAAK